MRLKSKTSGCKLEMLFRKTKNAEEKRGSPPGRIPETAPKLYQYKPTFSVPLVYSAAVLYSSFCKHTQFKQNLDKNKLTEDKKNNIFLKTDRRGYRGNAGRRPHHPRRRILRSKKRSPIFLRNISIKSGNIHQTH